MKNESVNRYNELIMMLVNMTYDEIDNELDIIVKYSGRRSNGSLSAAELRTMCRSMGFHVQSNVTKSHMIEILRNHLHSIKKDSIQRLSS